MGTQLLWIIVGAVITFIVRALLETVLYKLHVNYREHPVYDQHYTAWRKR